MLFYFFDEDIDGNKKDVRKFDDSKVKWQSSANRGEWSELYTLYKLIDDQNLFPKKDENNADGQLRLPILSLLRYTDEDLKTEYLLKDKYTVCINANGYEIKEMAKTDFEKSSSVLIKSIKEAKGNASFQVLELDNFRKETFCPNIKCFSKTLEDGTKDKSDIYIVYHDAFTGQTPKLGFSIKSELGNPPTLLNATKLTNFKYKLSKHLPLDKVEEINSMLTGKGAVDIAGRVNAIIKAGVTLVFHSIDPDIKGHHVFYENLLLIDSSLPTILAELLLMSFTEKTKSLSQLTQILTELNPLKFPMQTNNAIYHAKVKRFVADVALGMVPSKPWKANNQASGILVVKDSGDIDCYHVIFRSALEDFLYKDLKFDTPSATRHQFGTITVEENGEQYFTLNLQLRFVK